MSAPGTPAPQDSVTIGHQVDRLGYDFGRREQLSVVVPHPSGPEREVEDDVGALRDEIQQPARSSISISVRWPANSGTVVIPRRHIATSKDRRTMPWLSNRWAYVDFPAPEGPHMRITRPMVGRYVQGARSTCALLREVSDVRLRGSADGRRVLGGRPRLERRRGQHSRAVEGTANVHGGAALVFGMRLAATS